ncbi:MAG TPA: O-antigen ligase family protein [Candidatus Cloacimonadota bacterium]|nr:O-antigen ligase family protein [Candidatus Cloacimonadota bacterium]HQB40983.1 O-antigen ligase family protein [Candidatus Cloacimonadota bacterium]
MENKHSLIFISYCLLVLLFSYLFEIRTIYISALILMPSVFLLFISDIENNLLYLLTLAIFFYQSFRYELVSTLSFAIFFIFLFLFLNNRVHFRGISKGIKVYAIAFFISFMISFIFARYKMLSITWLFVIGQYMVLFVMLTANFDLEKINKLFISLLIPFAFSLLVGFTQMISYGFDQRIYGLYNNSNIYGGMLTFFVLLSIYLYNCSKNTLFRMTMLVLIIFASIQIIFTYSRGAQLGFIASLGAYIVFKNLKSKKRLIMALIAFIMIFLIIITAFPSIYTRFLNLDVKNATFSELDRLSIWLSSVQLFQQKPIYGIGVNNFQNLYKKYHLASKIYPDRVVTHLHSHNLLLNVLSAQGLIGLITYFIFLWYFFKLLLINFQKRDNDEVDASSDQINKDFELWVFVLSFFAYYVVHGMFDIIWTVFGRHRMHLYFFLWLACVNYLLLKRERVK